MTEVKRRPRIKISDLLSLLRMSCLIDQPPQKAVELFGASLKPAAQDIVNISGNFEELSPIVEILTGAYIAALLKLPRVYEEFMLHRN